MLQRHLPLPTVETTVPRQGQAFSVDGQVLQQEHLTHVWLRSCQFSEAEYQKWEWAEPIWKDFFFNVATSKCITKQRQESNYPRGGCHEKSYFSQLLQCILRSSALCQVADKGRILHAWDHAARAIRLMGFGLNSRPAPLRRTDAGFFQMSVSTAPRVENGFMARKGRSDFSSWWSSSSLEVAFPLG